MICRPTPSITIPCASAHHIREGGSGLVIGTRSLTIGTDVHTVAMGRAIRAASTMGGSSFASAVIPSRSPWLTSAASISIVVTTSAAIRASSSLHLEAHGVHVNMHRLQEGEHGSGFVLVVRARGVWTRRGSRGVDWQNWVPGIGGGYTGWPVAGKYDTHGGISDHSQSKICVATWETTALVD